MIESPANFFQDQTTHTHCLSNVAALMQVLVSCIDQERSSRKMRLIFARVVLMSLMYS